ncbi:MAG: urease accessory protein UreD [Burkholderiales bacterium]|nr:urease accessory protein UreD [Burkholderiales bacterium]
MTWHARLQLRYAMEAGRSVARFEHDGPLRILQSLYPEGDAVCHNVVVHPPGGLVGGDTLDIDVRASDASHGLVTTPGAARFYRSDGAGAVQRTGIRLDAGARFEWLPLEAIYYPGCIAENRVEFDLAPGAEAIGWDIAAFGLPQAGQAFDRGNVLQHLELRGAWLEHARIDAADRRLMDGPLGLAGHRCLATLFLVAGDDMPRSRRELALELARQELQAHPLAATAGATSPGPRVVVVRVLAPLVEPAVGLLRAVRRAWRTSLWGATATDPRGWAI